jgi:glycine betaine/choline ABC-type transport system substrate-binding protein
MAGRAVDPRRGSRRLRVALVAGSLALAAALYGGLRATTTQAAIVIGSKNFTEQIVLGELLAQTIEATGLIVERRLNLGGTLVCDEALKRGDIDGYVEYTGTALTALFEEPFDQLRSGAGNATLSARVLEIVRERYADSGRTLLPGLGFNNTFAILVRTADRDARTLRTISDLARVAPEWRAGFGYEFLERPDGFPGLARTYNLRFREAPRVMDLNLIYRAVASGEIDVTAGDATSGLIRALNLTILQDDLEYFPPYDAAPVFRTATLLRYPEADRAIRALAGRITADDMQRLNHEVDGLRKDPRDVVAGFLANEERRTKN